ncbi:MAG: rRNA maturation RNase YbeY [Gammaproteobacteria bacterium]|nr:rRNA maturation RNase YbeY [Gammaproteobacteria bacterium]
MYQIDIQLIADKTLAPKKSLLRQWAKIALSQKMASAELGIRIVDIEEMTLLNATYRKKNKPTNVLSFPFSAPQGVTFDQPILGDIVICAAVVNQEAIEQKKSVEAHWAHMIVHGIFHLLGYDHETDSEAEVMERLEIQVMEKLGFKNPYR